MSKTAEEFLHRKDVAYMNRLSTSLDFDRIVKLMEEYASIKLAEKDKVIEILNAQISELNKKTDDLLINIEELSNAIKKSLNK